MYFDFTAFGILLLGMFMLDFLLDLLNPFSYANAAVIVPGKFMETKEVHLAILVLHTEMYHLPLNFNTSLQDTPRMIFLYSTRSLSGCIWKGPTLTLRSQYLW